MGRPKKIVPRTFRCLRCDRTVDSDRNFFKNKHSQLYQANDGCVCICRNCVDELFDLYTKKYNSLKKATMIMCCMLDYPYIAELFEEVRQGSPVFSFGIYVRRLNNKQFSHKTTEYSLMSGEFGKTEEDVQQQKEVRWSKDEAKVRDEIIDIVGYDCFDGYPDADRRILFAELSKFISDEDDSWKTSQIIKAVVTNYQIDRYDKVLSRLDIMQDSDAFAKVSALKKDAVAALDKIAKENEISIKSRSNKEAGRSTLTYLMRELREKDIEGAEANYYDQLRSPGTLWAAEMSAKAILANGGFDENDRLEIQNKRNKLIKDLYDEVDELKEQNRQLMIKLKKCGGEL